MVAADSPRPRFVPTVCLALWLTAAAAAQEARQPPVADRQPETRQLHGREITDHYHWLTGHHQPPVRDWVRRQNDYTEAYVAQLPGLTRLQLALDRIYADAPPYYQDLQYGNGVWCAVKDYSLVVIRSEADPTVLRVLVDRDRAFPGRLTTVDTYRLSPDGKYVAASLSQDGLEEGTIYVYETGTGKKLDDAVPQAFSACGGDICWDDEGTGFYYTRYPNAGPRGKADSSRYTGQQLWYHKLGAQADADRYVVGKEFPPDVQMFLVPSRDARQYLLFTTTGWAADQTAVYWFDPARPSLRPVSRKEDKVSWLSWGFGDSYLAESFRDAPRGRLLDVSLPRPGLAGAKVFLPQGEGVISGWTTTVSENYLCVVDRIDGSDRLRVIDSAGKEHATVPVPKLCGIQELAPVEGDQILYKEEGYFQPATWYRYNIPVKDRVRLGLSETWRVNFDDIEAVRTHATAPDGTEVPMTLLRPKGCPLDGSRPVLLEGYGGFGEKVRPYFYAARRVWFDHGGVWAVAHPRGEGELGDEWHLAARGRRRQVSTDDFIACAEHLVRQKYTRPEKLAIYGGSHGGLLVASAFTQRPDLFAAAMSYCGQYDMVWDAETYFGVNSKGEYGDLADPDDFQAALAASPYHRVAQGKQYPAVWLLTAENDRRVDPAHSWKMAAKLQVTGSRNPVLLTTGYNDGHFYHVPLEEELAFLFARLGVRCRYDARGELPREAAPAPAGARPGRRVVPPLSAAGSRRG